MTGYDILWLRQGNLPGATGPIHCGLYDTMHWLTVWNSITETCHFALNPFHWFDLLQYFQYARLLGIIIIRVEFMRRIWILSALSKLFKLLLMCKVLFQLSETVLKSVQYSCNIFNPLLPMLTATSNHTQFVIKYVQWISFISLLCAPAVMFTLYFDIYTFTLNSIIISIILKRQYFQCSRPPSNHTAFAQRIFYSPLSSV